MDPDKLDYLYNCSAIILERDITFLIQLNHTDLLAILNQALVTSTERDLLWSNFTDCLFAGKQRPFDLEWWQKLSWSAVFAVILTVATGGNIIVMWIVLGMFLYTL